MFRPEPLDLLIIALVALLIFGANRLPETARAIGQALKEFRNALSGKETEPKDDSNTSARS
jgi:TatA/E family protein of Tat protein translocase